MKTTLKNYMQRCALMTMLVLSNIFFALCPYSLGAFEIAILKSYDQGPYNETISAFSRNMQQPVKIFNLEGDPKKAQHIVKQILQGKPDIIFSVGTKASVVLSERIKDVPIVTALVSRPEKYLKNAANIVGISMNPDPLDQVKILQKLYTKSLQIGIIYNPNNSAAEVMQIENALPQNMTLIKKEVLIDRAVPEALREMGKKTDLLWLVVDEILLKRLTFQNIIKFSITHKYPVIGFSMNSVKRGALFSSITDFEQIGKQAAEVAHKILKGKKLSSFHIYTPKSAGYVINGRVAKLLHLKIKNEVQEGAVKLFR